jgi:hypothetical protein
LGSKLRRGARCFAPYLVRTTTTHGSRELTTRESQPGNEKGGWCKPPSSLELTPQNRKPSRGWDPATPGSQSFSTALRKREQTMCHGVIGNSQSSTRMKLRELAYLSVLRPQSRQWPPTKSHRQIRVYIHSFGETWLLHRRDTQDPSKTQDVPVRNRSASEVHSRWRRNKQTPAHQPGDAFRESDLNRDALRPAARVSFRKNVSLITNVN